MSKKIFEPIEINGMELKNRIGLAPLLNMPGIYTKFTVSDETNEWFEARARGGTGLIMTGNFGPMLLEIPGMLDSFARLADIVHSYDAKLGVQIGDGGPLGGQGPSPMPYPNEKHPKKSIFEIIEGRISFIPDIETVTEFTVEQIEQHKEKFPAYAAALKERGVDCVELHCAHGGATLYCSFISPFYNRRTDDYGGSWEKRLRFPTETIRNMRKAVGDDYPLFTRISADELLGKDGITLDDTVKHVVPALEEAGVDCFDVSQGSIVHSPEGIQIPLYYPRGCYIHNAEAVKKATSLPVIGVGNIFDLDMAEEFLQEGKADIIYMGRQLTSDPETPQKYFEGRSDEIRKCIGCIEGCGTPCTINYDISPGTLPLEPAEKAKNILIIGGGVAGMEAARVCSLRGHSVTLFEKDSEPGGMVAALAMDPLNAEFGNFTEYLTVQMKKQNVDIRLSKEAGEADVDELNPDAVIMAAGSSMIIPKAAKGKPGVMDHIEALRKRKDIGNRVVVWGLAYGAELAVSLADEGKDVTLIGESDEKTLCGHASNGRKWWFLRKLSDVNAVRPGPETKRVSNPAVMYNIKVEDVSGDGVRVTDKDGKATVLPYDTLVISRGRNRNNTLYEAMKDKVKEIYQIGDCAEVANIQKAVWSANEVARKI